MSRKLRLDATRALSHPKVRALERQAIFADATGAADFVARLARRSGTGRTDLPGQRQPRRLHAGCGPADAPTASQLGLVVEGDLPGTRRGSIRSSRLTLITPYVMIGL